MAWARPEFDLPAVDKAGKKLLWTTNDIWGRTQEYYEALEIVGNWRSCHSLPLNVFQTTLRDRARSVDPSAIIAQRLKRLASIEGKLRRQTTRLTQMQDIGGCRAVLRSVAQVDQLNGMYRLAQAKNPRNRHEFVRERDYIREPKPDGYRSIHLIYRYHSRIEKHSVYNGLQIEIQLRSRLQHAWATAVETAGTFTGQALKWRGGQEDWQRFFALMGTALAGREKSAPVPGTPSTPAALKKELQSLSRKLQVEQVMRNWTRATRHLTQQSRPDARFFLLRLDIDGNQLYVSTYRYDEQQKAADDYLIAERRIDEGRLNEQVVLVSVDSIEALRTAYPNYYVDTSAFIRAVQIAIS